jgi:hypothetical protein
LKNNPSQIVGLTWHNRYYWQVLNWITDFWGCPEICSWHLDPIMNVPSWVFVFLAGNLYCSGQIPVETTLWTMFFCILTNFHNLTTKRKGCQIQQRDF